MRPYKVDFGTFINLDNVTGFKVYEAGDPFFDYGGVSKEGFLVAVSFSSDPITEIYSTVLKGGFKTREEAEYFILSLGN